mgnify:CR=1 FL=1
MHAILDGHERGPSCLQGVFYKCSLSVSLCYLSSFWFYCEYIFCQVKLTSVLLEDITSKLYANETITAVHND